MSIKVIFTPENWKYIHVDFAINVIQMAKYRKYMHIDFAMNVIQTTKNRKCMHIKIASCSSWTYKNNFGVIHTVHVPMFVKCWSFIFSICSHSCSLLTCTTEQPSTNSGGTTGHPVRGSRCLVDIADLARLSLPLDPLSGFVSILSRLPLSYLHTS